MEHLALTSKILYDRDYLNKCRELYDVKKATARKLFYHGIDTDLRELNAHVIRCNCNKCMDMMGNNYPKSPHYDDLCVGDVFFMHHDESAKGAGSMYGALCEIVDNPDESDGVTENYHLFKYLVRLGKRSSKDCLLMAWFREECQRHQLPCPEYHFGIRSLSLWVEQGHQGMKWQRIPEFGTLHPECESWRDIVYEMPYPTQVERIYYGLLHTSLGGTLVSHGHTSSVREAPSDGREDRTCDFEDFQNWFKVGSVSLLP